MLAGSTHPVAGGLDPGPEPQPPRPPGMLRELQGRGLGLSNPDLARGGSVSDMVWQISKS